MLTRSHIDVIEQYVDDKYFDKDKLTKYLSMHSIVGNEVFSYCDKGAGRNGSAAFASTPTAFAIALASFFVFPVRVK